MEVSDEEIADRLSKVDWKLEESKFQALPAAVCPQRYLNRQGRDVVLNKVEYGKIVGLQ